MKSRAITFQSFQTSSPRQSLSVHHQDCSALGGVIVVGIHFRVIPARLVRDFGLRRAGLADVEWLIVEQWSQSLENIAGGEGSGRRI